MRCRPFVCNTLLLGILSAVFSASGHSSSATRKADDPVRITSSPLEEMIPSGLQMG